MTLSRATVRGGAALVCTGLLLPSSDAFAWRHLEHVWSYDDMPIPYYVATPAVYNRTEAVNGQIEVLGTGTYNGFSTEELVEFTRRGFQNWRDFAACADFRAEPGDELSPDGVLGVERNTHWATDGDNIFSFNDPPLVNGSGQIINGRQEPGVLASTLTINNFQAERFIDGTPYFKATESDILFNDAVNFVTNQQILENDCQTEPSIEAVMTHEIGHLLGLGHSCEQGEECNSADLRTATMFWNADPCAVEVSFPNEDDQAGINALYGPFAEFRCSHELDPGERGTIALGVVPFTLNCQVMSEDVREVSSALWSWGDGTTTEELPQQVEQPDGSTRLEVWGTHEYTEPGNFTVRACFEGSRTGCGDWEYCLRRPGYVRACDVPEPVFSWEGVEGLRYRFLNDTDVAVYGCYYDIQWDIFEGEGTDGERVASLKSWEPEFSFPSAGTYTIVLNLGGPAGTGASALTLNVANLGASINCSHLGGGGFGAGLGLLGLAWMATRRRRR